MQTLMSYLITELDAKELEGCQKTKHLAEQLLASYDTVGDAIANSLKREEYEFENFELQFSRPIGYQSIQNAIKHYYEQDPKANVRITSSSHVSAIYDSFAFSVTATAAFKGMRCLVTVSLLDYRPRPELIESCPH